VTRARVAAVAFALAALAFVFYGRRGPAPSGPAATGRVLLLTLDTLRADRLGVYGSRAGLTPALDALGARGTVFEEGLASAPLTLPSHSTILSGLEPPHHGVHDNGTYVFPPDLDTLATLLKAQGYATGAFVGAYVLDRRFGLARGFDVYDDRIARGGDDGPSALEAERPCEEVVNAAQKWMSGRTGASFAWVHLYDAHAPYAAPEAWRAKHGDAPYDAEVAHLDSCIATLLDAAGKHALVAVVADHGEALGEHGEPTHGFFVYQSTLRVPFLMAGPGIPAGEKRPGPARTADVLPTLLARLGVAPKTKLDGADLLAGRPRGEAYAESLYPRSFGWAPLRAFRAGRFKLIDAPKPELYDLAADPSESKDLAAASPQDAQRLRSALAAFRSDERRAGQAPADAETVERLKALGYVAAAPLASESEAGLRDPKDALRSYRAFEEASWKAARGEHAAAVAALRPLVAAEPGNPTFRRTLAASLRRLGREREAAETMASLEQDDAVAWHERAVSQARAGRRADAIASERRAIELNPLLPEPFNHLGTLEAAEGRLDRALAAFEAAAALDPNNARAWNNRGNALRALGRRDEAGAAYRRASELQPRDPDPLNGLGVLLVQSGRPAEAAALFERALALAPSFSESRINLAVALVQQGKMQDAARELETLLRSNADPAMKARARGLLAEVSTR
jgi:arylsulfatase A-like enzyme/Tfp pilus assembly protein PilF